MSTLSEQIPSWMPGWRRTKDRVATAAISAGGAGVLMAILLIFFYLLYEVFPLFQSAKVEQLYQYTIEQSDTRYLAIEEQGELALAISETGEALFFDARDGATRLQVDLAEPAGMGRAPLLQIVEQSPESRILGLGYGSGEVLLVKHDYRLTYPNDVRVINARIEYTYGPAALAVLPPGSQLGQLAVRDAEEALVLAASDSQGRVHVLRYTKEENFLSGEIELTEERLQLDRLVDGIEAIFVDSSQRWLYVLDTQANYLVVDLASVDALGNLGVADSGSLFESGACLASATQLLGGISLLAGSTEGELAQYFVTTNAEGSRLAQVRTFESNAAATVSMLPEQRRKGFLGLSDSGELEIFHTTAGRRLIQIELSQQQLANAALSPRADRLLVEDSQGQFSYWDVHNKHPDISWDALWGKVWYESYQEPEYIWQSSASNNDFEPKYSFSPLAFGTLKAAFYAMLIAAPLAICGAIFTAYFMAPALRRKIKPLIELMEALPTVILGFLAGLWLAPFVEASLAGVFSLMLFMPVGVLFFAFLWSRLPLGLRARVPDGWQAAILIPVVILIGYSCFAANDTVELLFFNGDMRAWVTTDLGISFDQRNALVVGIAMGLAVIPTIFSIAEDAIFGVPKHLSYGSLALGATPWQTLVGVVLPTASPGIFSALMIGLGRAVGETMIVLMATGNTPIMDANIFEGMRTLAANIAVEVPEAEVDSTHYRVLFLAAFVLFMFTFVVNTFAELVRQRLRIKYGSL